MKKIIALLLALALVSPVSAASIVVQPGDTLSALAARYNTTIARLVELNSIANPDRIYAGQTLTLDGSLGASIPTVVAVYTDSLASRISSSATSFTLVRGTDKQSRSLSGFYGFVIDEGTTSEEFMTANCVATACTIVSRGIDVQDGETSVTALKYEHRRGATIKMTNFPQLAILSRILNGQESASSTFRFGGGDTAQNKVIYADNGTAAFPFIRFNETTGKWQYSDDGTNTINLSTSTASGLSASTTKAVFITDSQIGVNASSTASMAFDSNGYLYVNPVFTRDETHSGTETHGGQVTLNGSSYLNVTPTTTNGIARFDDVSVNATTGTSGVAISAGQVLRMGGDSKLYVADSTASTTIYDIVGVALEAAGGANVAIRYVKPGGIATISGVTAGTIYYIGGSGGVGTTKGTVPAKIGVGVGTNKMLVMTPEYHAQTAASLTSLTCGAGTYSTTTVSLEWRPTNVQAYCADNNYWSQGTWIEKSTGGHYQTGISNTSGAGLGGKILSDAICEVIIGGPLTLTVRAATTTNGIAFGCKSSGAGANLGSLNYIFERSDE